MRALPLLVLAGAVSLAGCAGVREHTYGNWLESVGRPVPASVPLSAEAAQGVRAELASLRVEAESLRMRLAAEPSRVQRIAYYRQLDELGTRIVSLQQTLRSGGYEAPTQPAPPPAAA